MLGRVHHVVHRPEQAVGVVLDAAVRVAVGVDDRVLGVGLEVAVGVLHQPQIRRLTDQHAVIEHLQGARHRQLVGEHRLLVHPAVVVGVLEHADPVERLARVAPGRVRQEGQHLERPTTGRPRRSPSGSAIRSSAPRRRARRDSPAAGRRSSSPPRGTGRWTSPSASSRAARCCRAPWMCPARAIAAARPTTPVAMSATATAVRFTRMSPRLPAARTRRVGLAVAVAAVRHRERAVRLRRDLDPVRRRVRRHRCAAAPPPGGAGDSRATRSEATRSRADAAAGGVAVRRRRRQRGAAGAAVVGGPPRPPPPPPRGGAVSAAAVVAASSTLAMNTPGAFCSIPAP